MPRARRRLSAWERRNKQARQRGYASYYDYRIHDYGRIPARKKAPTGEARTRLRGHRSRADLQRKLHSTAQFVTMGEIERGPEGEFRRIRVDVIDEDGTETQYWLSGSQITDSELADLEAEAEDAGVSLVIWYHGRKAA